MSLTKSKINGFRYAGRQLVNDADPEDIAAHFAGGANRNTFTSSPSRGWCWMPPWWSPSSIL